MSDRRTSEKTQRRICRCRMSGRRGRSGPPAAPSAKHTPDRRGRACKRHSAVEISPARRIRLHRTQSHVRPRRPWAAREACAGHQLAPPWFETITAWLPHRSMPPVALCTTYTAAPSQASRIHRRSCQVRSLSRSAPKSAWHRAMTAVPVGKRWARRRQDSRSPTAAA